MNLKENNSVLLIALTITMLGILTLTAVPNAYAVHTPGTGTLYMYSDSGCTALLPQQGGIKGYVMPATGTTVYIQITGITEVPDGSISILLQYSGVGVQFLTGTVSSGTTSCIPWVVGTFGDVLHEPTEICATGVVRYGPAGDTNVDDFYSTLSNGGSDGGHFYWGTNCGGYEFPPSALTAVKTATPSFKRTYSWGISKSVDKTLVEQIGGTATFNYEVDVTHDSGTDSDWKVAGTITVTNPNTNDVTGVTVSDAIDNGGTCTVSSDNGVTYASSVTVTVPGSDSVDILYKCTFTSDPGSGTNTATVSWPTQTLGDPYTSDLQAGSVSPAPTATYDFSLVTPTIVDGSVTVTDTFNGVTTTLGTVYYTDPSPTPFTYSHTVNVPTWNCVKYDNTATFTTSDTGTTGSDSKTVEVCGPAKTGALTMGFWKNKNGQNIIGAYCGGTSGTSLYTFLTGYNPFKDLTVNTCSGIKTYVSTTITAASASGASMNAMLKAQMLATALDVYFSDPALGGNRIGAPAPIGGISIDLTMICENPTTCSTFIDTSSAFGGTPKTVLELLSYASSQSNSGGTMWYGNVKATQELAKDTFDAINNQVVFSP
jgi:hypothetical protein